MSPLERITTLTWPPIVPGMLAPAPAPAPAMITCWCGRDVRELTHAELLEAFVELVAMHQDSLARQARFPSMGDWLRAGVPR